MHEYRITGIDELYSEYTWVEFAARRRKGFRNLVIPIDRIEEQIARYQAYGCYASAFLFPRELVEHVEMREKREGRPSVSGYSGKVHAYFLPLDIDAPDLEDARMAALEIVQLAQEYGFDEKSAAVYYSGSKGFHIMLRTATFGDVEPGSDLHLLFQELRQVIAEQAGEYAERYLDRSTGDRLRLLRLPDTINEKSNLYKIQLTHDELEKMSAESIRRLAQSPRGLKYTDRSGLIPAVRVEKGRAQELLDAALRRLAERGTGDRQGVQEEQGSMLMPGYTDVCPAIQAMFEQGVERGNRNNACVRMASAFRRAGVPEHETLDALLEWNTAIDPLPEQEIRATVRSVYARERPYSYGCNDPLLRRFCPYKNRMDCRHYRMYKATVLR